MNRKVSSLGVTLVAASIVVACGSGGTGPGPSSSSSSSSSSGGGGGPTSVSASAKAEGGTPASGSDVIAVWSVSTGSPDYLFVFGRGKVNGDSVTLDITTSPPAEALNKSLGIAVLIVVPPGTSLPDGKLSPDQAEALENVASSISARHAIIYRADQAQVTRAGWENAFPQGYACGECVPHPEDAGPFDSFKTTDCSAIRLQPMSSKTDICNWT